MRPRWARLAGLLGALAVLGATASVAAQTGRPPLDRPAIEAIIREYLLQNPEVILEAVRAMQERQQAEERQRVAAVLAARRAELYQDAAAPVAGNPRGDVTVVEFFDYQCRYCKTVVPALRQLLEQDRQVRFVFKEFPILGPESVLAARAALAARAQGKYVAFHQALMAQGGPLTLPEILRVAAQVKLDPARLQADMEAPEIRQAIQKNLALAQELGIRGTPVFVIGGELVTGALELDALKDLVAKARAR
jgi:protein-disulfide isomerase